MTTCKGTYVRDGAPCYGCPDCDYVAATAARKDKKVSKPKKKKKTHGGTRKGAGRPATGRTITAVKYIRCSEVASNAIDEGLATINADRAAAGLKPVSLSRFGTEAMLKALGREDLTESANPIT